MSTTNKPPQRERADATGVSTCGAFSLERMATWKTFDTPPLLGEHVLVVFYWPDNMTYNMEIMVWQGWDDKEMENDGYGTGTYPISWMPTPEYPKLPNIHG